MRIANPEGFDGKPFLTLGEGSVDVSLGTLFEDVLEIPALTLSDLRGNLERRSGRANYEVILANLAGREGDASSAGREGKRYVSGPRAQSERAVDGSRFLRTACPPVWASGGP